MKTAPVSWLLVPALAVTLAGCPQREPETTSTPPGGPPAGAVSAPPGPGATTPAGTPAPTGAATDAGHPTPPATGSTGNEILIRKVKNALIVSKVVTKNVGVSVNGGDITLTGSVPTMTQKELALKAAKQVPGVTSVKDKLTAEGPK
jgi:hyperosmotically inducible protein